MISRKHRFHGRSGLRKLHQSGKSYRGGLFALKVIKNPHRQDYRLAVVVSRKVEKSAVRRNRIRRRIYGVFSDIAADIIGSQDLMIVVFDPRLIDMPPKTLKDQLVRTLQDARIFAKNTT